MRLSTEKREQRTVLTTQGSLTFKRAMLRPTDAESRERLFAICQSRSIFPMDIWLGIDRLPFKMTVSMMLRIAEYTVDLDSYQDTEDFFSKYWRIQVSDDQIRKVTDYLGDIVLKEDLRTASLPHIDFCPNRIGTMYIKVSISTGDTRGAWSGYNDRIKILSGTIVSILDPVSRQPDEDEFGYLDYAGSLDEFAKLLYTLALKKGSAFRKQIVILFDGSKDIRQILSTLFPGALFIVDFAYVERLIYHELWLPENDIKRIIDDFFVGNYSCHYEISNHTKIKNFITANEDSIKYDEYRNKGLIYDSRSLSVFDCQLKIPHRNWKKETLKGFLLLRSKWRSGQWHKDVIPLIRKILQKEVR